MIPSQFFAGLSIAALGFMAIEVVVEGSYFMTDRGLMILFGAFLVSTALVVLMFAFEKSTEEEPV